jgi:4'-phosphopantetheinyl transferase
VPHICEVWLLETPGNATLAAAARATLSSEEREQASRFRFANDRRNFELAHGLCRYVLARHLSCGPQEVEFETGHRGKPAPRRSLHGSRFRFSISHTTGLVGIAVSESREIGFDLEDIVRPVEPKTLGLEVFTHEEMSSMIRLPDVEQVERFFRLWVLKEAYIKARGLGMYLDLKSFRFEIDSDAILFYPSPDDVQKWSFHLEHVGRQHLLAVAVPADAIDVVVRDGRVLMGTT